MSDEKETNDPLGLLSTVPSPIPLDRRRAARARTLNAPGGRVLHPMLRELLLRAMDGNLQLGGLMHCLARYNHRERILLWLIRNRMTGKTLETWLITAHGANVHKMVEFIIAKMNEKRAQALDAGKRAAVNSPAVPGVPERPDPA